MACLVGGTAQSTTTLEVERGNVDAAKLPPIRLLYLEDLMALPDACFPRYPEQKGLIVTLPEIDHDETFVVFVSHCWLRGHAAAEGYDGRPHPDTARGDKFRLIKKGIHKLWKQLAPGMRRCAIWLDFACIDQDGQPAGELKQLDLLIACCDCLFTPIFEEERWHHTTFNCDWYVDYKSPRWSEGPFAYLNRGWCRVEMFFSANIPVRHTSPERLEKFVEGLNFHLGKGRRPHFLYGNNLENRSHIILPPLQHSYFEQLHPEQGHLSVASDLDKIRELVEELRPYMSFAQETTTGATLDGKVQGTGERQYANGDLYTGDFLDGLRHGHGRLETFDGDVYTGMFLNDEKNGYGELNRANGNSYKGLWWSNMRHGSGEFRWISGDVYRGEYVRDKRQSPRGVYTYSNGDRYEGEYRLDYRNGLGSFTCAADGSVHTGIWAHNKRNGRGVLTFREGDGRVPLEGVWKDDALVEEAEEESMV